jgi:hypothetical protein
MTGALLGMLVELAQLEPVFADAGETPDDALARVVPLLVLIADGGVGAFRSDLFLTRAQHRGIGVVVFGGRNPGDAEHWARERGLPYLVLPADAEAFGRLLDEAKREDRRSRLAGDRRASARTEHARDGTLIFQAGTGERWFVYDRRSGERRRSEQAGGESYRVFVNEAGLELTVRLDPQELQDQSPATLEHQLARAEKK